MCSRAVQRTQARRRERTMTQEAPLFLVQFTVAASLACAATSTLLGACATNEARRRTPPSRWSPHGPIRRCSGDADAGRAAPMMRVLPGCAPDTLCPSGPFNAEDPASGLDWRTRITSSLAARRATSGTPAPPERSGTSTGHRGRRPTRDERDAPPSGSSTQPRSPSGRRSPGSYARGLEVDAGQPVSTGGWSAGQLRLPITLEHHGGVEQTAARRRSGSPRPRPATHALWRIRLTPESTFESRHRHPGSECSRVSCRGLRSFTALQARPSGPSATSALPHASPTRTKRSAATPIDSGAWIGLRGAWAASDTDVWAVGGAGTILHYAGEALTGRASRTCRRRRTSTPFGARRRPTSGPWATRASSSTTTAQAGRASRSRASPSAARPLRSLDAGAGAPLGRR